MEGMNTGEVEYAALPYKNRRGRLRLPPPAKTIRNLGLAKCENEAEALELAAIAYQKEEAEALEWAAAGYRISR